MKNKLLQFLQQEIDLEHIPGAVLHISYSDDIIFQEAVGNRILYPEKSPMSKDTIFDLASLTKVVATLPVLLKLIDAGEIRLEDPIAYFLSTFHTKEITLKHLLAHTSGLPAHRQYYKERLHKDEIVDRICKEALVSGAGERVLYSDLGLILLYKIIEIVVNENFEEFVERELFNPLNMKETGFNLKHSQSRYAATEYSEALQGYKQGIVHDENAESMGGISGHAGLFSTINDLGNFSSMIENEGVFNGKQIISSPALVLSKVNFTFFDREHRGLGWMLKGKQGSSCGDLFSNNSYGHTGYTGTSIWFDPDIKLNVILLTNRVHVENKNAILRLRPRLHNIIRSSL
ncbi:beta-lactamase family protein [Bacillus sp. FJAT-49705]|uniref:Beta-lactamase family protein n=1 Tax=Cytobacillus citreus TaxID=2833586 RepID=A0ABS5NX79_9BACI|nr:beta-lactamase family protein [Cytobacillus citreus]